MKWLRTIGIPWSDFVCYSAIKNGHLAVLQWLHQEGASLPKDACNEAAVNGHLEILKWLSGKECFAKQVHMKVLLKVIT